MVIMCRVGEAGYSPRNQIRVIGWGCATHEENVRFVVIDIVE